MMAATMTLAEIRAEKARQAEEKAQLKEIERAAIAELRSHATYAVRPGTANIEARQLVEVWPDGTVKFIASFMPEKWAMILAAAGDDAIAAALIGA